MTDDTREQLLEASAVTKKAYGSYRRDADPEEVYGTTDGDKGGGDKGTEQGEMSPVILIMQPILRFLQLLCENHNRDLQVCVWLSASPSVTFIAFLFFCYSSQIKGHYLTRANCFWVRF